MYCRHCGKKLDENELICGRCGTPVSGKQPKEAGRGRGNGPEGESYRGNGPEDEPYRGNGPEGEPYRENGPEGEPYRGNGPERELYRKNGPDRGYREPEDDGKEERSGGINPLILVMAALALLGLAILFVLFSSGSGEETAGTQQTVTQAETVQGVQEADGGAAQEGAAVQPSETAAQVSVQGPDANRMAPVTQLGSLGVLSDSELARSIGQCNLQGAQTGTEAEIDVFAEHYQPGPRNMDYAWDRTLFYSLEDVDPNSLADGKINGYTISRKIFRNAVSGNTMEYEIYTNPATGKVNKIVSIEYLPGHLEITDYYYTDTGKISFIFVRDDINYVPSYAVPTKDGQRFYFNSDCMTKWRVITGGAQTNFVLGQASAAEGSNAAGSVRLYPSLDAASQANYDAMEKRMINAAYNTYHTVLGTDRAVEITGYVYKEDGSPQTDARVALTDPAGTELYAVSTDADGKYQIFVPAEEENYQLNVTTVGCPAVSIYNVAVSGQAPQEYQDTVYMAQAGSERYPVSVQMYDALNYAADGNGMQRLSDAWVRIRSGMNNREGGIVAEVSANAQGLATVELYPGMYTAEVQKSGYTNTYYNFLAGEGRETVQINASPTLAQGEVRVVLTWGSTPQDLDSHLFLPYDDVFGNSTYHIWYGNKQDSLGNNLDVDDRNGYGPETVTISSLQDGLYKYYVVDYSNSSSGNPQSEEMSRSGARVDVYTENGLAASYTVPVNREGVIWEVFEIRNGEIVPIQRYYSNIEENSWWHRN